MESVRIRPLQYVVNVCNHADLTKHPYTYKVHFDAMRLDDKDGLISVHLTVRQYILTHAYSKSVQITVMKEEAFDEDGAMVSLDLGVGDVEAMCDYELTKRINEQKAPA